MVKEKCCFLLYIRVLIEFFRVSYRNRIDICSSFVLVLAFIFFFSKQVLVVDVIEMKQI